MNCKVTVIPPRFAGSRTRKKSFLTGLDAKWVIESIFAAGWSSPVAREAHNLEVVGSNPAPATQTLRSHVASDRGVFSCAGRDTGPLIPQVFKGFAAF